MMTYENIMRKAAEYVAEERPKLNKPELTADFLRPIMMDLEQEEMHIICLNTRNNAIHHQMITRGTLSECMVHPREIFRVAIKHASSRIIVAHNHPSGDTKPSRQDIDVTKTLYDSGEILNIPLVDHIIIGGTDYTSLRMLGYCG